MKTYRTEVQLTVCIQVDAETDTQASNRADAILRSFLSRGGVGPRNLHANQRILFPQPGYVTVRLWDPPPTN